MLATLARRLAISVPLILLASIIIFVLESFVPGDAARAILGIGGTPEAYERLREQLHLNLPLWQQYWLYLQAALHGDLGSSIFTGEPVVQTLATRIPVTLALLVGATALCAIVGISLGVASAKIGGWVARVVDVVSLLGLALPNFWLALLLVAAFAVAIPIFPAIGYVPFAFSPSQWALSLALPVIALAIGGVAQVAKITRDGMSDALETDYIRTLRAAGVSEASLTWKHALRNSSIPVITVIGLCFIGALSGSIYVESVFVLPGLGSLVVEATGNHDVPVIQGVTLAFTAIVIVVNLVIDIAYARLNPKLRTR